MDGFLDLESILATIAANSLSWGNKKSMTENSAVLAFYTVGGFQTVEGLGYRVVTRAAWSIYNRLRNLQSRLQAVFSELDVGNFQDWHCCPCPQLVTCITGSW